MDQEKRFIPVKARRFIPARGARLTYEDAQIVGDVISAIEEENGYITPEMLIKEAEHESSPIHEYFEWDDEKAARQYRITQARSLIRSVLVHQRPVTEEESRYVQPRAFLNVSYEIDTNKYRKVYLSTDRVLSDPEMAGQVTNKFLSELRTFETRFTHWRELLEEAGYKEIFVAIDNTLEQEGDGPNGN